jgi:cytochrome c553
LNSPSSWQQDTVQRLLVHRKDIAAVSLLEKMTRENKHPLARLHAMCTLDGLNAMKPETIKQALNDPHPGIRRHAVRLSEPLLRSSRAAETFGFLLKRVDDPDPHVRMQLAYTLGEWNNKQTGSALGRIMLQGADKRYLTAAATSSVNESNVSDVLQTVLKGAGNSDSQRRLVGRLLSLATRLENEESLVTVFSTLTITEDPRGLSQRFTVLAEVLDALSRRNKTLEVLRNNADGKLKAQLNRVPTVFHAARSIVKNETANGADRVAAVRLLGRQAGRFTDDLDTLANLLVPQNSGALQSAAVQRLGELGRADVPKLLLPQWKMFGPALRSQVLDVLLSRSMWAGEILEAIAKKRIAPTEIDAARCERLIQNRDLAVQTQAIKLLEGAVNANRRKVLDDYRTTLTLTADFKRGKQVFAKNCSTCHKIDGAGHEVGPDLVSLKNKSPESLLVAILDPNRNI